jgi:HB1, ASXL, restriction endonuclease HTH domain
LDMVKTKQSVPQITQALERGGLPPAKTNTVYAVLRRRENDIGDIIRLGDEWALAEWYPNNPNLRRRAPEKTAKKATKKKKPSKKVAAPAPSRAPATLFEPTSIEPVPNAAPPMTMLDASEQVLLKSDGPLHARDIAESLKEYGKNTTASSLSGSLVQDTKKRFKNIGGNTWDLVERPEK